jgi:hypothetical protein
MQRESRNGLRPVTVIHAGQGIEIKGYLINFNQEGNLEDGIGLFAAVELEDGSVGQFDAYGIKFDDVVEY